MSGSPVNSWRAETLKLRLECDLAAVRPAALEVSAFLRDHDLEEERVRACELALVEACNNAIQYVGASARSESVFLEVLVHSGQVELRVNDRTPGFVLPPKVELPAPESERGRGLFLIQNLMDEVIYLRGEGRNSLVMRKAGSGKAAAGRVRRGELAAADRKVEESERIISEMAEELSFCYESLSAIFRCSAELGRTNNLEEFSQRLLTDLVQITSAEWFVLRLPVKEDSRLAVFAVSEPALQLMPLPLDTAAKGFSAELEAALGRQDVWFDHQRPLDSKDPLGSVKKGAIGMVHPFYLGGTLVGTLTVGKEAEQPNFTAVHANVIHTFADFLAIQIANARFQEEQLASRVLSRELEIAKNIQRSLLPKSLPKVPGYSLAGYCESASEVGGDFYDVLRVTDQSFLLIVADVMGKGMPAAIFAAILRSLLRAVPEWSTEPAALLTRVNRLLFEELDGVDMFITAQLLFVDTREHRIVAASAGHCPALVAEEWSGKVKALSPEGLPLGILPDTAFQNQVEPLGGNHRVLLYTDGLTEARNQNGEFFGQERLMRWFQGTLDRPRTAGQLKEELAAELKLFQANSAPTDDQTFLILAQ